MDIEKLCAVVKISLPILVEARAGEAIDHSFVDKFQEKIKNLLNAQGNDNGYVWDKEQKARGRSEKDSVDIWGVPSATSQKGGMKWIIEIDATRSDQVSQKFLSRVALWGLNEPIQYVAVLYPDTQNGKRSCEKYLRYCNAILQKINSNSSVVGIFVDPMANTVEVLQLKVSNHFDVNGMECKSMGEACAEAIRMYLTKHPMTFADLTRYWKKYVLDQKGPSRYRNAKIKTSDGIDVYTYTQFRQYGLSSYWAEFERLCKAKGIIITKMRKLYTGTPVYTYKI